MKIYISGKITGLPIKKTRAKFRYHESILTMKGYNPVNPFKIKCFIRNSEKPWIDYMREDIGELLTCDAIYMLKDWGQSKGARIEYQIAKELGLQILFEGEFNAA